MRGMNRPRRDARVRRVRLGVVGLGAVAQAVHLPLVTRRRDLFEVTAVCDLSAALAERVTDRFGLGHASRHRSIDGLLDAGDVDALLLLTSGSHGAAAAAALGQDLPVLCEKPLAYTLAEADALASLAGAGPPRLQLGYMKLHDPAVRRARLELDANRAALRAVEVTVLHPPPAEQLAHAGLVGSGPNDVPTATVEELRLDTARLEERALGPASVELRRLYTEVALGSLVHDLAVVRLLAGDPERVEHADAWPPGRWPPSVAVDALLPAGVRLTVRWHYLDRYPAYREELRLYHEEGSVTLAFPSPYLLHAPTVLTVSGRDGDAARVCEHRSTVEAFEEQLAAFHRLVTEGTPPAAGVAEGRADILTCQRIVRCVAARGGIELGGEAAAA
jgi:myo-inositol 2-dehydrogenase / D-chiro-inositol 1-dehydrogenase